MGGKDLGQCPPFLISVRPELDVGQSIAEGDGDAVAFEGLHVRSNAGDGGRLIVDLPTKMLHLTRANDGAAVAHVSRPRNEEDAGSEVSVSDAAGNGKAQIVDSVIIDAIEVDGAREVGVDASVTASNGAVGATIDQSKVLSRSERVN